MSEVAVTHFFCLPCLSISPTNRPKSSFYQHLRDLHCLSHSLPPFACSLIKGTPSFPFFIIVFRALQVQFYNSHHHRPIKGKSQFQRVVRAGTLPTIFFWGPTRLTTTTHQLFRHVSNVSGALVFRPPWRCSTSRGGGHLNPLGRVVQRICCRF